MPSPAARRARLGWRALLAVFALVVVVQSVSPDVEVTDSRMSVPTAYAVITHGTLHLDAVPDVQRYRSSSDIEHIDGHLLPLHPWPAMLFAVPGTLVAEAAGVHVDRLSLSAPSKTYPIEVPTAAVLVGLTALLMALVAWELVGAWPDRRRARFAAGSALLFAFGTSAWSTASRALWAHTPAMLFSALALLAAMRSRRDPRYLWVLGVSLALGYTMRPTLALPLVVLGVWAVVAHRVRAGRVVAGGAFVGAVFVAVNLGEYHRLLPSYYTGNDNGLHEAYGYLDSLGVQLISPSRGLFVYSPILVVAMVGAALVVVRRHFGLLDAAVAVTALGSVAVIVASGSTGGTAYGNRLITDTLPYLWYFCLPALAAAVQPAATRSAAAGPALRRTAAVLVVVVLAAASVAVNAVGATAHSALCWSATPRYINTDPGRVWDWSDPQFLRPFHQLADGRSVHEVVLGSCGTATGESTPVAAGRTGS